VDKNFSPCGVIFCQPNSPLSQNEISKSPPTLLSERGEFFFLIFLLCHPFFFCLLRMFFYSSPISQREMQQGFKNPLRSPLKRREKKGKIKSALATFYE